MRVFSRKSGLLVGLLALLLMTGCEYQRQYSYRPIKRQSPVFRHEIKLSEKGRAFLSFKCSTRKEGKGSEANQKILVEFTVANRSDRNFEFLPAEAKVMDEDDRTYEAPALFGKDKTELEASAFNLAPKTKQSGKMEFPLPPELDLQEIAMLRFVWAYRVDGKREEQTTKFVQVDPYRNDYYYWPHYGCHSLFYYHRFGDPRF